MSRLNNTPIIHPDTQRIIEQLAAHQPHALLLHGEEGVGLRTIAQWYGVLIAADTPTMLYPDEKGSIGIDEIRDLYKYSRVKRARHFIIIDDADTMTEPAQNALLKLLEEPSDNVTFLLTSHNNERLLETIRSRVQQVIIRRAETEEVKRMIAQYGVADSAKTAQLLFLADGYPAEMARLISDDDYFEQKAKVMRDARVFLQGSSYDKIQVIYGYGNDRSDAMALLRAAIKLIRFSFSTHNSEQTLDQLDELSRAQGRLQLNGHVRTQLLAAIFKT